LLLSLLLFRLLRSAAARQANRSRVFEGSELGVLEELCLNVYLQDLLTHAKHHQDLDGRSVLPCACLVLGDPPKTKHQEDLDEQSVLVYVCLVLGDPPKS
jgi:hypothetical protein